jgi:hypothetical protein
MLAWDGCGFAPERDRGPAIGCSKLKSQKKKDQLALALNAHRLFSAIGPILTIPGGWGLRNPKPKGPGQRSDFLVAT